MPWGRRAAFHGAMAAGSRKPEAEGWAPLEGNAEEGVGGVADQAGVGWGDRAGRRGEYRVGPGVDDGERAGRVQVVGEALANGAQDGVRRGNARRGDTRAACGRGGRVTRGQ